MVLVAIMVWYVCVAWLLPGRWGMPLASGAGWWASALQTAPLLASSAVCWVLVGLARRLAALIDADAAWRTWEQALRVPARRGGDAGLRRVVLTVLLASAGGLLLAAGTGHADPRLAAPSLALGFVAAQTVRPFTAVDAWRILGMGDQPPPWPAAPWPPVAGAAPTPPAGPAGPTMPAADQGQPPVDEPEEELVPERFAPAGGTASQ